MLVIREAFSGVTKFMDFQRNTGAAKNILTSRLDTLCKEGIFDRIPQREGSTRYSYVLTAKGKALFPMIVAIGQWGDRWVFGPDGAPVSIIHKQTEAPVQEVAVFAMNGQHLDPGDVVIEPGSGSYHLVDTRKTKPSSEMA